MSEHPGISKLKPFSVCHPVLQVLLEQELAVPDLPGRPSRAPLTPCPAAKAGAEAAAAAGSHSSGAGSEPPSAPLVSQPLLTAPMEFGRCLGSQQDNRTVPVLGCGESTVLRRPAQCPGCWNVCPWLNCSTKKGAYRNYCFLIHS